MASENELITSMRYHKVTTSKRIIKTLKSYRTGFPDRARCEIMSTPVFLDTDDCLKRSITQSTYEEGFRSQPTQWKINAASDFLIYLVCYVLGPNRRINTLDRILPIKGTGL